MSTLTAPVTARPTPTLHAARVVLALMGAMVVYGSIYFSVVAPPEPVDAVDWVVAAWALATGTAFLVVAVRLGRPTAGLRRLALALLASHVVFGLVKVVGYSEAEAGVFIAVDLLAIGLLWRSGQRGH